MEFRNHMIKESIFNYVTVELSTPLPPAAEGGCLNCRGFNEINVALEFSKLQQYFPDKLVDARKPENIKDSQVTVSRFIAQTMESWIRVTLRDPKDPLYSRFLGDLRGEALRRAVVNDSSRLLSLILLEEKYETLYEIHSAICSLVK